MKYTVRLTRVTSGRYIACCNDPKRSAATKAKALEKIRGEIRYRLG
jgi:hypothetical protein